MIALRIIATLATLGLALGTALGYGRGAKDLDPWQWPVAGIGAVIVLAGIWR